MSSKAGQEARKNFALSSWQQRALKAENQLDEAHDALSVANLHIKRLRGLGTPGQIISALEKIASIAEQAVGKTELELTFWKSMQEWASEVLKEEKDDVESIGLEHAETEGAGTDV